MAKIAQFCASNSCIFLGLGSKKKIGEKSQTPINKRKNGQMNSLSP